MASRSITKEEALKIVRQLAIQQWAFDNKLPIERRGEAILVFMGEVVYSQIPAGWINKAADQLVEINKDLSQVETDRIRGVFGLPVWT